MIYRRKNMFEMTDAGMVDLTQWKYAKAVSLFLVIATIMIFILLGNAGG